MVRTSTSDKLLKLIAEKAFKYSDEPTFKLASGRLSNYYINCKMVTLDPVGLNLIGEVTNKILAEKFGQLNITAVGGLTLGADPISVATSLMSYQAGTPLKAFVIRKEAKKHGLMKWVEGDVSSGENVVITEDVITTGMSTLKAIDRAKEAGLNVVGVITLVDREEGGVENIKKEHDVEVCAIALKSDLLKYYRAK